MTKTRRNTPKTAKPPQKRRSLLSILAIIVVLCCGLTMLIYVVAPPKPTLTPSSVAVSEGKTSLPTPPSPSASTLIPTKITLSPLPTVTITNAPLDTYAQIIRTGLAPLTLPKDLVVQITEDGSSSRPRQLLITYITGAKNQQGYNNEWISILQPLGKIITDNNIDLDIVQLAFGEKSPGAEDTPIIGVLTANIDDVETFSAGKITRLQLLNFSEFTPVNYPASAKPTQVTKAVVVTNAPTSRAIPTAVHVQPSQLPVRPVQPVNAGTCSRNPSPRSCAEALQMGLSAEDAAKCSGTDSKGRSYPLDKNGNGRACYGD